MIRELNRDYETKWDEKIQIELSLEDLQVIYDCIGAVPPQFINIKHKNTSFNRSHEYHRQILHTLYEDLHTIISEHNGVTDDDMMVDTEVDLELVGVEE